MAVKREILPTPERVGQSVRLRHDFEHLEVVTMEWYPNDHRYEFPILALLAPGEDATFEVIQTGTLETPDPRWQLMHATREYPPPNMDTGFLERLRAKLAAIKT